MVSKKKIIEVLLENPVRNINMVNFIREYPAKSIRQVGSSFLIRGISDHQWVYVSSKDVQEFEELITELDENDQYFAIIEDWMLPYLAEEDELEWILSCMKLYYPADQEIQDSRTLIEQLTEEDAHYIFQHSKYREFTSIEYIIERITKGVALGVFNQKKLVAWLMTHDDGAIGFLHVLPDFRGRGYARDLTYEMIKRLRSQNQVPFIHIEEDNIPSMSLAEKTGFVKDRLIHWFKKK